MNVLSVIFGLVILAATIFFMGKTSAQNFEYFTKPEQVEKILEEDPTLKGINQHWTEEDLKTVDDILNENFDSHLVQGEATPDNEEQVQKNEEKFREVVPEETADLDALEKEIAQLEKELEKKYGKDSIKVKKAAPKKKGQKKSVKGSAPLFK